MTNADAQQRDILRYTIARERLEGDPRHAQKLVNGWLQKDPDCSDALALRALLELDAGNVDKAFREARQAVALDENSATAFLALAAVLHVLGQPQESEAAVKRSLVLKPDDGEAICLAARHRLAADDTDGALRILRQAPLEQIRPRLMLAEVLLYGDVNAVREASRLTRAACDSHPHLPAVWALHGLSRAAQDEFVPARWLLETALMLGAHQQPLLLQLTRMLLENSDLWPDALDTASRYAEELSVLAPHDWRGPLLKARVAQFQGRKEAAISTLESAAHAHSKTYQIGIELALAFAKAGLGVEAARTLNKFPTWDPAPPSTVLAAARLHCAHWLGEISAVHEANERLDELTCNRQDRLPAPVQYGVGLRLSLHADSLQECLLYVRYAQALASKGVKLQVLVPVSVAPLLQRVKGIKQAVSTEREVWHRQESIRRLPALAGARHAPSYAGAYLTADASALAHMQALACETPGGYLMIDASRRPRPGVANTLGRWVVAQGLSLVIAGAFAKDWRVAKVPCRILSPEAVDEIAAALCSAREVLLQDSPLAHLAGGLGVAADVLLYPDCDSLWGLEPQTSWYPTLRLHRFSAQVSFVEQWRTLEQYWVLPARVAEKPAESCANDE